MVEKKLLKKVVTKQDDIKLRRVATGTIPFKPGEIVFTDLEKKQLEALGFKEGDLVPPNLPEYLKTALQAEQRQTVDDVKHMLPVPEDTPALKYDVKKLENLPPERQKEIRNFIETFQTKTAEQKKQEIPGAQYVSGVADILKKHQQAESEKIEITDSRKSRLRRDEKIEVKNPESIEEHEQDPEPEEQEEAPINDTGVEEKPRTHCPHCYWPLDKPDDAQPSEADIISFVHSILGNKQFIKEYSFFDGSLKIAYRDLTSKQVDSVFNQLQFEIYTGRITNTDEFWRRLTEYRTLLALKRVVTNKEIIDISDEVDDFLKDPDEDAKKEQGPDPTVLRILLARIKDITPFNNETVWRLANQFYQRQFARLVEHLEARADQEGFWKAARE